ncbi:MAG: phosphonate metabolism protein/1,5-bisphosphokinase (PRPP-forming) PhnN [Piscinibacter sp.]|uniref:phosphonate metabolism protein/1,5-bisphosphokinase (PRPP-forming) PhnN n=1 Tax=Piscinibacter sp. TaxID=1903157 RepID=UPI003D127258
MVVGPSGAGKDSVISAWLRGQPRAARPHRVRRTITRPADVHEAHESIGACAFAAAREAGAFAFHWQAHGLDYGIRHGELAALAAGGWVVMNGSREHLAQLRAVAPQARVVEIDAPAALRQRRLHDRSREDAEGRAARIVREAPPAQADLRIVNDGSLDEAVATLERWWNAIVEDRATGDCGISTPGAGVVASET